VALLSLAVSPRWIDLVDPSRDELLESLPTRVDPEVIEALAARPGTGRAPRPLIESHGSYVFAVFVAARPLPEQDRIAYLELGLVATTELVLTVRKSPAEGGEPFEPAAIRHAADADAPAGQLVHRLADDVADSYLDSVDELSDEIDELEDSIDAWPASRIRARISDLRHDLLDCRRTVSATRASVRRIVDGRVEIGDGALFPGGVEMLFAETSETLIRVTEDLDIARDLLAGVRDHHQSKIAEGQADIAKKLTIIASLVLVPSLIVGYYGQNFASAFDRPFWSLGFSSGLILASTLVQLAVYRWRRWI
jgi:Mg2+ and Co2+ transporter CorA